MQRGFIMVLLGCVLICTCTPIDDLFFGQVKEQVVLQSPSYITSPAGVEMNTGERLIVFRSASSYTSQNGKIMMIHSLKSNNWSQVDTLVNSSWDCRTPYITQLTDGTLWIVFIQIRNASLEDNSPVSDAYMIQSYDRGLTFTSPRRIPDLGFDTITITDGLLELNNGNLILPIQTKDPYEKNIPMILMSTDGGETWESRKLLSGQTDLSLEKPIITLLPKGPILCMLESTYQSYLYQIQSEDGGLTWSQPYRTSIYGRSPDLVTFPSGIVVCSYRDETPHGISLVRSYDLGETWNVETPLFTEALEDYGHPLIFQEKDAVLNMLLPMSTMQEEHMIRSIRLVVKAPQKPHGVTVSSQNQTARLRWNSVKGASYYLVFRSQNTSLDSVSGEVIATTVDNRFTDTQVDTGQTYYYQISTVMGSGKRIHEGGSVSDPSEMIHIIIQ